MEKNDIIYTGSPKGFRVTVNVENDEIKDISGFEWPNGKEYAKDKYKNSTRILPTTIRIKDGECLLVSVKTEKPIPKRLIF